ncbi:MAG: hypothetical protein R2744_10130 [Bacteroidales bacterium]
MKKLLILGAGTGGTIMANKMRKELARDEWKITIVDKVKSTIISQVFFSFHLVITKGRCY